MLAWHVDAQCSDRQKLLGRTRVEQGMVDTCCMGAIDHLSGQSDSLVAYSQRLFSPK
jgi:hypothetical protein